MRRAALRLLALLTMVAVLAAVPCGSSAQQLTPEQRDFATWRFGMFLHFNLGTFADLDWAGGWEDPDLFAPAHLDCGQWADTAREGGMRYLVLSSMHRRPTRLSLFAYTTHDVTLFRRFRGGHGDVVREFVAAC